MTRLLCLALLFAGASCAGTANRDLRRMNDVLVSPLVGEAPRESAPLETMPSLPLVPVPAGQEPRELDAKYRDLGIGGPPKPKLMMQGYIGANFIDEISRQGGSLDPVEGNFNQWPVIGGGGQWVLGGGKRVDLGLEGMINFGWRANAAAFAVGGGGAVVAVDLNMLAVDFYGGPFLSKFIGDQMRVYGGVGPVIQFVNYDQQEIGGSSSSGSGFGAGFYARTGFEMRVSAGTLVGLGARWLDTRVDLDSGLGNLDVSGVEVFFSVTQF